MTKFTMRRIAAILAASVLLGTAALPAQAVDTPQDERIEVLGELEIMTEDAAGAFHGELLLTRAQLCKILLTASEYKGLAADGISTSPFPDVPYTHWAAPYVAVALQKGVMQGYSDGTFRPEGQVLYEEAVVALLRLLGYSSSDYVGGYPAGMLALAAKVGVTEEVEKRAGETVSRAEMANLVYNTLNCAPKGGSRPYAETLGCTVSGEELTMSDLISTNTKGPYVLTEAAELDALPLQNPKVYRDGRGAALSDLQTYDVYCYSTASNTLWAYSDRVSGTVDAISPSREKPASVTVDGKNYTLSGEAAKRAFGLDGIGPGEAAVLLLDRDGSCAGAYPTEGPVAVTDLSQIAALPAARVYRNGASASLSDVARYDIIYYSAVESTLWAYSDKITGRLEAISPNKEDPSSVTVGGKNYALSADAARDAFGLDGFRAGEMVTLLLDRDGNCAAACATETLYEEQAGYVTGVSTKSALTADGSERTGTYASVLLMSGGSVEVPVSAYSTVAGKPVTVQSQNGEATLRVSSSASVTGTVSSSSRSVGSYRFADEVTLIDVDEDGQRADLLLDRLDGVVLQAGDVLLASFDADGRIDGLILDDVTGDARSYGVVLTARETEQLGGLAGGSSGATTLSGSYTYDVGGVSQTYSVSGATLGVTTGPAAILTEDGRVSGFTSLIRLNQSVESVNYLYLTTAAGARLRLSDDVACYIVTSGTPVYASLEEAMGGDYAVTAYYDKAESAGGRVRVLYLTAR